MSSKYKSNVHKSHNAKKNTNKGLSSEKVGAEAPTIKHYFCDSIGYYYSKDQELQSHSQFEAFYR